MASVPAVVARTGVSGPPALLALVVLAQRGVVICVGVLVDTLVVRTVLVPATALVLGERFWWPRRVGAAPYTEGAWAGTDRTTAPADVSVW